MAPRHLPWKALTISTLLVAAATLSDPAAAVADGEALFKKNCSTCHTADKNGGKRQGPNLWAVVGRTAGSVDGFPYSDGLKHADWSWTPETLDKWLEDPQSVFSDSYMMYRQSDPEVRHKIIGFLQTKVD